MSVRGLARELDVAAQSVHNWETGKMGVSDERAAQMADVFGMPEIEVRRGLGLWVPEDSGEAEPEPSDAPWETLRQLTEINPDTLDPDTLDRVADTVTQLAREIRRLRGQSDQAAG